MLLMGQPHVTKKMFQSENMQVSGFIPRFLFAEIPSELQENDRNAPPIEEGCRKRYNELVIRFLKDFWPKKGRNSVEIEFTKEALDVLHGFRTEMVKSNYANRLASVDGLILRLREQAIRLSIVLHAASAGKNAATDTPGITRKITAETVRSAIAVVRWSFEQYMSYNASAHEEELDAIERKVLRFVKDRKEVTARNVSRKFKGDIGTAKKAELILRKLVRAGLIAEIPAEEATNGRPRNPRYASK
jgi:hypothetical protein